MASKFITVSIEIMHDKNLSPNQKFILAEIEQLSSLDKGCFASNKHFSELIGISKQGVSNAIMKLSKDGYISIDNSQTNRNVGRIITINDPIHSDVHPIHSDVHPIHSDVYSKDNIQENIQSNNKKNIKKDFKVFKEETLLKFKELKISTFKDKINSTPETLQAFSELQTDNKHDAINLFANHVRDKKGFAKRLDRWLLAYNEGSLHLLEYNKKENLLTDLDKIDYSSCEEKF